MSKLLKPIVMLCCVLFYLNSNAQTPTRTQLMQAENKKIEQYVAANASKTPQSAIDKFKKTIRTDVDHPKAYTAVEIDHMVQAFKRNYWVKKYFERYPAALDIYQAPISGCDNGDFEDGNLDQYTLESTHDYGGSVGYNGGQCEFDPFTLTYVPEALNDNTDNFLLVYAGIDALAGINTVNSGNRAVRINGPDPLTNPISGSECAPQGGINKLSKKLVLENTTTEITFYYAVVLEEANHFASGHQPTFIAIARDQNGTELDRVCNTANPGNPFYEVISADNTPPCNHEELLVKDWACKGLEVSGNIGDTIILEFYATDCGHQQHFGYAYVDDICERCTEDTCNTTGSIDLSPTDSCFDGEGFFSVCGSYVLPAINCEQGSVESLTLSVIQNGSQTALNLTSSQISIDETAQTFCINLQASDFPSLSDGGYDFLVEMNFSINSGTHIETDYHTNAGEGNDVVFDCTPVCCRGNNMMLNGDFDFGLNAMSSDYTGTSTIAEASVLPGMIAVGNSSDASIISPTWNVGCNDNEEFLLVNGLTGQSSNATIWTTSIPVVEGRYSWCGRFKNLPQCGFDVLPSVSVLFSVSGYNLDNMVIDVTEGNCEWMLLNQIIDVPAGVSVLDISIVLDQTGQGDGNDLAIDKLTLIEIEPVPASELLFDITPYPQTSTTYTFEAEPTVAIGNDCQYSWSVAELDGNFEDIPSTVVENPIEWQTYPAVNTFMGYDGTSTLSGTNDGVFELAKTYRITFTKWCDCELPNSRTYYSMPGRSGSKVPILREVTKQTNERSEPFNSYGGILDEGTSLRVFPSPTYRDIDIVTSIPRAQYKLSDSQGRLIKEGSVGANGRERISLKEQPPGIYLVQVIGSGGELQTKRIVKR